MKKILLTLLIGIIGFIGFGNCSVVHKFINGSSIPSQGTKSLNSNDCFRFNDNICARNYTISDSNNNVVFTARSDYSQSELTCVNGDGYYYTNKNGSSCTIQIYSLGTNYCPSDCPVCEEQLTSTGCQQEYSLMPISSCNSEYCGLNGLCPEYTGSTMSELYINGINHISAPIINFTIPMDIAWDYELTGSYFNLVVSGNNGDQEYIEGLINVNSYRPTSEDFTQTFVGGLTLIFPYIIITAMILFLWRFIKKIFK